MTDNNSRKQLFAYLQKKGVYEDEGKFNKDMDSEEGRRALFDTMYQGGAGMSWDEFDANLRPDLNNAAKRETEQAKANAKVASKGSDNGAEIGSQPVNTAKAPKGDAVAKPTGNAGGAEIGSQRSNGNAQTGKQGSNAAPESPAVQAGSVGTHDENTPAGNVTREGQTANGDNAERSAATAAEAAGTSGEAPSTAATNAGERLAVPYNGDPSNFTTWRDFPEGRKLIKDTHDFFMNDLVGRADEFVKYGESRADKYLEGRKDKDVYLSHRHISDPSMITEMLNNEITTDWYKDPKKVVDNFNKILGIQKVDGAPKKGKLIKNGKEYDVVNGYVVGTPEQEALNNFVLKQLELPTKAQDDGEEGEKKVAPLTEEQQQAWLEMYNDKMDKVVECIQDEIWGYLIDKNMPKNDFEYIVKGAWKDSTLGTIRAIIKDKCKKNSQFRAAMMEKMDQSYEDWVANEAEAAYLNRMGFWHRALVSGARGAGAMLMDAPIFEMAGFKSAALGEKFGSWVGMKFGSKLAGNVAGRALAGGLTFGNYDLIQEGLRQVAAEDLNGWDLLGAYGKGVATGSLLGAGNTVIDGYAEKLLDKGSKAAYYATHAGGYVAEVAFFSASEIGQATLANKCEFIGWDKTFEILGKQGVMIGMLKAKGSLEKVYNRQQMLKNISENAGLTADNLKDLYDAGYTDNHLRAMFAGERIDPNAVLKPKSAAEGEVKNPEKPYLKKVSDEERAELVKKIIADNNVSWETKQKLMFSLTGVLMPDVAVSGVSVSTDEKGNSTIIMKDEDGNVISKKGVTKENVASELFKAQNKIRVNQVKQLEGALTNAVTQLPSAIEAVAKEQSMSYGRIVECLKAVEQGNAEKWQERIVERVKEVSKINSIHENVAWAAEAKAEVEKETGVELDVAMAKENPTANEMEAVDSYINRLTEIADEICVENDWISEKAKATTEARQIVETFADKLRPHVDQDGNVRQGVIKGENGGKPVFLAPDSPDHPDTIFFYREGEKLPFCVSRDRLVSEEKINFQQAMDEMEKQYVDVAVAKVENKKLGYHPDTPAIYTVGQGVSFFDGDGNTVVAKVAAVENGQVTLAVTQVGTNLYDGKTEVYSIDALKKFQSETLKFNDRAAEMSERSGIKYTPEWALAEQRKKDEQKRKDQETWAVKAQEFAQQLNTPMRIFRSIEEVNEAYGEGNPYAAKCKERLQEIEKGGKKVKTGKVIPPAKGWVDEEGNVGVFLPAAASEADIKETVLHEIVGHKGIPAVLVDGWDKMTEYQQSLAREELFNGLYELLDIDVKRKITSLAIRKYKGDIPLATDEYFASMAEKGEVPSWIGRVSGYVKGKLAKKGYASISDGDVMYLLWRSRQALSGDGKSLFGGVRDLAIRLKLEVDKMIGGKQVSAIEGKNVPEVKPQEGNNENGGEGNGVETFEVVGENGQPIDVDELGKILEELQASPAEVVSVGEEQPSGAVVIGGTAEERAKLLGQNTEVPAGKTAGTVAAESPEDRIAAVAVGSKFGVVTQNGTRSVMEIGSIDSDGMVQVKVWTDGFDQPNISNQNIDEVKELVAREGVVIINNAAVAPAANTAGTEVGAEMGSQSNNGTSQDQPKTAPTTESAGTPAPSAWDLIPVDEKTQKKDYTKATVEQTYQALQEKHGEDADMLANDALEAAKAKYEKVKKEGNPDDTGAAYREVKYWEGVANHIANKAEEARLAKVAEEASGAVDDIINDGLDPQDAAKQMLTFDEVDKMVKESISNEQDTDKKVAMERYWNTVSEELMPEYTKEYWDKHIRDISSGGSVKEVLDNMDPEMGEKMLMDFGVDQSYDLGMNGSWEGFKRSKIYKIMSTDNNPNISSVISSVSEENRQKRELWKEKYNQVQNRFRDGDEKSEEELSDKERKQRRYSRLSDIMKAVGIMMDKDGNPIDENGDYVYEDFNSAYDITDDDIEGGCRNVRLPLISESMAAAMNIDRRPVVIKRSVFKKNSINHPELGLDGKDQAMVLDKALYSSNEYINDKPKNKPYYWVTVHLADRNAIVTLDVDTSKKDRIEVVGWRLVNDKSLSSIEKRAIKDGGQIIISTHAAADLSALHDRSFSGGKDTNIADNSQINGAESGSNGENILFRDGSEDYPEFDSVDPELKDYAKDYDEVGEKFANYSGTIIKRGNSNKKNPMLNFEVGKMVGSQLYVHKDYVPEQIKDLYESAKAGLPKDFEYNCVMWDHKKPDMIRFDASPDFDTAREPITGDYIWMDKDGNFIRKGTSPQIWHHKWCWVGNDYKGFDVQRAYEWSRIFAKGLGTMPSGYENKWQDQLKAAGLGNVRFRDGEEEQISAEEARKDLEESMKEAAKQDYGSAETSLKQVAAAFKKIKWEDGTTNLDLGGGKFDLATEFLKDQGVTSMVFDPFNRDKEHNAQVAQVAQKDGFDTVTCNNVLNVINSDGARSNVILQAAKALKQDGTAYFSIYQGNKSGIGKVSKKNCWQNNRKTASYVEEVAEHFGDVSLKNGVIIAMDPITDGKVSVWNYDAAGSGQSLFRDGEEEVEANDPFYSPAYKAVEDLKQDKGTGEQFLKMIEKNGGLKKEEDKWIGLSDFLKGKKSVTKQEVLDYIRENAVKVEEVHYSEGVKEMEELEDDEFPDFDDWADGKWDEMRGSEDYYERVNAILSEGAEAYAQEMVAKNEYKSEVEIENAFDEFFEEYVEDDLYGSNWGEAETRAIEEWKESVEEEYERLRDEARVKREEYEAVKNSKGKAGNEAGANDTRLHFTLNGLDDKKEIALTVPVVESYTGSFPEIHFTDGYTKGKTVAWIRFGTKEVNGKKVMVIDEIQSQRHQDGREKGYFNDQDIKDRGNKIEELKKQRHDKIVAEGERMKAEFDDPIEKDICRYIFECLNLDCENLQEAVSYCYDNIENYPEEVEGWTNEKVEKVALAINEKAEIPERVDIFSVRVDGVPDAPFQKNWHEVAMKRALRYAAENGYDEVVWTDGATQARRYGLGGEVEDFYNAGTFDALSPENEGMRLKNIDINLRSKIYHLGLDEEGNVVEEYTGDGKVLSGNGRSFGGANISDIVGKDVALQILNLEEGETLKSKDIVVGGDGMKGFYDKMLPSFMNKYGKKWGVKVEPTFIEGVYDRHSGYEVERDGKKGLDMWGVQVTPEMKESVMKGQPMFRDGEESISAEEMEEPKRMEGESTMDYADRIAKWEEDKRNGKIGGRRSMWELEEEEFDLMDMIEEKKVEYIDLYNKWAEENGRKVLNEWMESEGYMPEDIESDAVISMFIDDVARAKEVKIELDDLNTKIKVNRDEQKARVDEAWNKYNNETPEETQDRFLRSMGVDPKTYRKKVSYADRIKNLDTISRFRDGEYEKAYKEDDEKKAGEMVREAFAQAYPMTKVVDKDGKPLMVYHGTNDADFTAFDEEGVKWFAVDRKQAERYANFNKRWNEEAEPYVDDERLSPNGVYATYINITKPFDLGFVDGYCDNDNFKRIAKDLGMSPEKLSKYCEGFFDEKGKDLKDKKIWEVTNSYRFYQLLKEKGYDGVSAQEFSGGKTPYTTYGVISPDQIKSAEAFTYDNDGKVIPLSQRMQKGNPDIRFRDPSTEWADGKNEDEIKRIEIEKCNEIIEELKKRGYDDFEKRVSVTSFGTSSYIIGHGLKFRISDHSVTNTERIFGEIFFNPNDGIDYFLGFIQRKDDEVKRVVEASQKRKEFEASLDDKWEKVKGMYSDQDFFRSDPTRRGYDEFAESTEKGEKRRNVVQVPENDYDGYWTGRYTYLYSLPRGLRTTGAEKPAKEFMLAIDDSGNIVNPRLGSEDMDKFTNKHYMTSGSRFRWVGEEGAKREDESEGNTDRMDGLKLAKKLAKNKGYDANKVKYATGWEQGADGMWRYEEQGIEWNEEVLRNVLFEGDQVGLTVADVIDDDNLLAAYPDLNNVFLHNFVEDDERQKGTRGYYRRSWFQSDVIAVDFETIPDMVKEIRKTKEGIERRRKWIEAYEKGNISDKEREELNILGLTPEGELENMRKRTKRDQDYIKGAEEELEVMVNNVKKTLNHEIQHFIQHQEGWATGGSSERIRSTLNKVADDLGAGKYDYESLNNRYTDLIETSYGVSRAVSLFKRPRYFLKMMDHFKYSGTYDQIVEKGKELAVDAFWKAYDSLSWENRDFGWDMSKFGIDYIEIRDDVERMRNRDDLSNYEQTKALALKWGDKLAKVYRKFAEAKYEDASWGKDMLDRLSKLEKDLRKYSDYELYHNIAGEVEARNAADRMNYTDVTRRMTLAVETESVKRGDQLVLDEHGNMRYGNEYGTRHPLFRDGENDEEGVSPDSDEQVGNWVLGKDGKLRWKEGRGKRDGDQDPNVAPEGGAAGDAAGTVAAAERKKRKNRVKSIGGRSQLLLDEGASGWQDYVRITLCGAKMRGENTEAGTRGLIEHTTGNRKDVANWCAKKGDPDALTPEELAEKIWESMPEGIKNGCTDQDVFNEILDTVMSYKSHKTLLEDLEKAHFEQEVDGIIEYEKEEADKYAQSLGFHDWEDYNSSADYNAAQMERIQKEARDRYLRRLGYDGEEGYRKEMVRLDKIQRKAAIKQREQEIKEELIAMVQQAESRPVVPVKKKGETIWDYAERVGEYQRAQQRYDEDHPVETMNRDQAMKAVRDLVNDQLVRDSVSQMDKRTLNSILRTLSSTNNDNLTASLEEAKRLVNRIRVRANQVDIQRLLDLKVADVNGKNMNIAKNVDDVTRRIMERLKTTVKDITESGLEDRIHDLRADNWRLREELRSMDPETDSQEILDKIEENNKKIDSLNEERKRILDKKGRDGDVNVDKAIEALQAKMDKDGEAGGEIDENDLIDMTALQIRKLILDGNTEDLNVIEMEGKLAAVKRAKRMLFDKYKDQLSAAKAAVDAEPTVENLGKWKAISQEYVNQRDKLRNMEKGLNRIVNEAQANKMDIQETLLAKLNDVVSGGKESLKSVIEQQQKNRLNVLRGAYNDIKGGVEIAKASDKDNDKNKKENWAKSVFTSALGSFEYMCQNIATNSLGKDSFMYKYFVTGDKGVIAANNTLVEGKRAAKERLDEKVKEIFADWRPDRRSRKRDKLGRFIKNAVRADGQDLDEIKSFDDWWQVMDMQPEKGKFGAKNNLYIDGQLATTGITVLDMTDLDEQGIPNGSRFELKDLSKGQATYIYQLWKMNDGRGKLEQMGFDEASMEQVAEYIGEENMRMADWIQDEFLQESREKYNSRYNEIYNTSMAAIENYVPLKINDGEVQENIDLTGDSGKGAGKLVVKTGALINRTVNDKSIDLKWSAAGVLWDHIEKMEEFYAFSPVRRDLSWVLSSRFFRNQVNKNSKGSFERLVKAAEIAVKAQQESNEGYMDRPMAQIQKGLIGGNIAYRTCTALKQMLSVPAFYGYSQDPEFMAMLTWNIGWMYGKNMHNVALSHFSLGMTGESTFENTYKGEGNRLQRLSDEIVWCMQNVPDFYDRVMKGTMGNVRLDEKGMEGALGRSLDKYMSNGMRANQMVDAITCGIGIKTIYDYKMKKARKGIEAEIGRLGDDWTEEMKDEYRKKKMEEEHNKAIMEATVYYNSTQQSNNVAFLSPMQVSKSFVDRFNTVYQNASLGFSRQFVSSVIDLNRQFKDRKRLNEEYVRQYLEEMGYKMDGTKIDPAGNAAGTEVNGEQPKTAAKSFEDAQREARMKAHDHLKNEMKKNFVSVALYGFILNAIWDQGNKFIAGTWLGDDQEEEKGLYDYATDIVSFVGRGTTGMNWISALLKGQVPQTGLAFSEISQFVENFNRINEESGFSPELAYLCAERLLRFGGVYPQTWTNMYLGTERFFRDSARLLDDNDPAGMRDLWMDLLACINNPNSSNAIRAKQLYMDKYRKMYGGDQGLRDHLGECVDAYVRDVSRAMRYKVEDDKWENWLPSIKVLKDKTEESLRKEFIVRNLTPDEREAMESYNEFKKEVKDLEDLDSAQKLFKKETDEGRREMIISKMRSLAKQDEADGGIEAEIAEMMGVKGKDKQEWERIYIQIENENDAFEDIRLSQKLKEMSKVNQEVNKLYAKDKDKEAAEYEDSHKEELDKYWEFYDIIMDLRDAKRKLDPAEGSGESNEEMMKEIRRIRREALRY